MSEETAGNAAQGRQFGGHTVWQVKASTLCNLRCRYCYEWDRLGDKRRITMEQWRRVIEAAAEYRALRLERTGVNARAFITWHGGEATLLPVDYVDEVLDLQVEVLGQQAFDDGTFANAVQTNLFRLNRTLELMLEENFLLSVSLDFMPGARVSRSDKDAEADALANLEEILSDGASCGVALVLGRHNHEHLCEIHDHLERIGALWLRIIPMLDPPPAAPSGNLPITAEETVRALKRLMEHRRERGSTLPVGQLDRAQETVARFQADEALEVDYDRHRFGDTRIVVHPDGSIASQAGTTTPLILGNVFEQPMREILDGEGYAASLDYDAEKRRTHCGNCKYEAHCNKRAVFDEPLGEPGPCRFDAPLCDHLLELSGSM